MADPRDTARQWLAEVLYDTNRVFSDDVENIADAILAAPGVEVGTERYRDPGDPAEVHTGVVIRLPVEVSDDG